MKKYKCDVCGAPTDNDQSFDIRGTHYESHRCTACDKRWKQELAWESEGETLREPELICPHCGASYDDYETWQFDEGRTSEVECDFCGRKFDLEVENLRCFSTKRSLCEMPDNYGEQEIEQ